MTIHLTGSVIRTDPAPPVQESPPKTESAPPDSSVPEAPNPPQNPATNPTGNAAITIWVIIGTALAGGVGWLIAWITSLFH